jgi:hypothetical protein
MIRSCSAVKALLILDAFVEQNQHGLEVVCVETMGCKVEYGFDLFAGNRVLLNDLVNGHAILKIFKNEFDRRPRVTESPRTAYLARNALHRRAL